MAVESPSVDETPLPGMSFSEPDHSSSPADEAPLPGMHFENAGPPAVSNATSNLPETTWWGAALRATAENIIPTAAGLATATGGALTGLATGPAAVVASPALAIGGGIAGANVAEQAQDEVLKRITPEGFYDYWKSLRASDQANHAITNFMAGFVPQAIAFHPSPSNVLKAVSEASLIATKPATYWKALKAGTPAAVEGFNNLVNVTLGASVGGAEPVYHAITDEDHDWLKAATAFGLGAMLNKPGELGKALSFHNTLDAAMARLGNKPNAAKVAENLQAEVPATESAQPEVTPEGADPLAPLKAFNARKAAAAAQHQAKISATEEAIKSAEAIAPATAEAAKTALVERVTASHEQTQDQIDADLAAKENPELISNEQPSQEAKAPGEETTDATQSKPEPVPETAEPTVNGAVEDGGTVAPEKPVVGEGVKPEPDALTPEEKAADDLSDEIHASKLPLEEKTRLNNRIADAPESHPEVRTEFEALRDTPPVEEPTPKEKAKPTGERVSGPVTMRGEKEGFVETLAAKEKAASPETLAKADAISENGRVFFEKHRTRINDQLSGYADIPGASDPASKIIDEANLKLREQALNGKEPAPSVILSSVTRDFIDQAKARREAGFTERSTESPAGSEGELTLGDTLSETKHSPEEVQGAAKDVQESVNKVGDSLSPKEQAVLKSLLSGETQRKGARTLKMDPKEFDEIYQSVSGKIAKQLEADEFGRNDLALVRRALDEGHVNYDNNRMAIIRPRMESSRGEPNGAEQPNAGSEGRATERGKTETGGGQKPGDEQGKASKAPEGSRNPTRPTDERVSLGDQLKAKQRDLFVSKIPEHIQTPLRGMLDQFQKLGVASDRLRIISGGKDQFGNTKIGSFDVAGTNFPSDWQVGWDEQGRKYLVFNKDAYDTHEALLKNTPAEVPLTEELHHAAALEAIRQTWNPKDGSFQKHLASELKKVADEAESIKSVLGRKGKNLLENAKGIYGNSDLTKGNAALELIRHITTARGDEAKGITEAFRKPGMLDTIKKYVERLLEVFKGLPQTSEIRRIVANVEALLDTETKPVDLGPSNPVEDVFPAKAPTPEEIDKVRLTDDLRPFGAPAPGKKGFWEKAKEVQKALLSDLHGIKEWNDERAARLEYAYQMQRNFQQTQDAVRGIQKAVPDAIKREGITHWIEAGGDDAVLRDQLAATKGPINKRAYEAALNLTLAEKNVAQSIRDTYDVLRNHAISLGMDVAEVENYVTHIWQKDPISELIPHLSDKSLTTAFKYSKARKIPSYFEGEQMGLVPHTKDASVLLGSYMNDMNQVLAARQFVADLAKGKAGDGRPLSAPKTSAGSLITVDDAKGKAFLLSPDITKEDYRDYKVIDRPAFHQWIYSGKDEAGNPIMFRSDVALHPEAYNKLKNIFGNSAIKDWWTTPSETFLGNLSKRVAKFLLDDLTSYTKGTLFGVLPAFHAVQEGTHALGHSVNPFSDIKRPDLGDAFTADAAKHGLMLAPDRLSMGQFQEGVGDVQHNLVVKAAGKIPGIGPKIEQMAQGMQEWLFQTYIPALKMKTYKVALERNMERFSGELKSGKMSHDQLKYLTADQVNNGYGHLNYMDIARNPTLQHIMRLGILAPDFLEARIKQAGQGFSGVLGNKNQLEQARALAMLTVGFYTAARVGNMLLNDGDTKLEKPFSIVHGNREYSMRSVPADILALFNNQRQWISGRLGPIPRTALEGLSGVNYRGESVTGADTLKDFVSGNVPIPLQPLTRGLSKTSSNNPVSPLEQLASGLGFHVSRYSPTSKVYELAKNWKADNAERLGIKVDKATYPISQYQQLRYALDDGDLDRAVREWQKLSAGKNGSKVLQGFKTSVQHPFTGSREHDAMLFRSLSPDDKQTFRNAVARRGLILRRVGQMFEHIRAQKEPALAGA